MSGGLAMTNAMGVSGVGGAGSIASIIGALGNLGSMAYKFYQQSKETPESRRARKAWETTVPIAHRLTQQLYFAPFAQGSLIPHTGVTEFKWNPSEPMRKLYEHFLTREYGLSDDLAATISRQRMAELAPKKMPQGLSPNQALAQTSLEPGVIAQSLLEKQKPKEVAQMDYLASAAQLAAFNLWRTQYLQKLIG